MGESRKSSALAGHPGDQPQAEAARLRDELARQTMELQQLRKQSLAGLEGRRAALNVMEDAVHAQQALERENGERRRAEIALRASEEKYRTLFESIDEGFCIIKVLFDPSGRAIDYRFLEVNPGFEHHTGCSGALGRTMREIAPAHEDHWFEIFGRVATSGEPLRFERDASALGRYYDVYAFRVGAPGDNLVAILFRDISEHKRREANAALMTEITDELVSLESIEDSMARLGEKLGRHFEVKQCVFSELTEDLEIIHVLYGWNAEGAPTLKGTYRVRDFLFNEQFEATKEGRMSVVDDTQSDSRVNARSYGALGIRSFVIVPLFRAGKTRFLLSILDDRPRHWRSDEVQLMREISERIWARVERARAEAALRAAKEEAEAASRAKDSFLAALSHELRNPLNPVLLCASELAGDPALPAEMRGHLRMIHRNIDLEARLIDDLLDLTRITRGKMRLKLGTVDAHALLRHTEDIVRVDATAAGAKLQFVLEAEDFHVRADAARLQQVFWNLIKNAIKFSGGGGGQVCVRTFNPAPHRLAVEVRDNGVGISPEAMDRIFRPFEQGDQGGSHRFGGLGLGLVISKTVIDLHGGELRATSAGPGAGSTFSVELATIPAPAPEDAGTSSPAPSAGPLRLLIVEDHEPTLQVLGQMLQRDGHRVHCARTVAEALDLAASHEFDLLISDIGLPDRSGVELMRELRPRGWPGIALSGYGMDTDVRESLTAGFHAHLVKPLEMGAVRRAISDAMASKTPAKA